MVHVNIEEIRKPGGHAQPIADSIQPSKRIMFRRAMKRAMERDAPRRAGHQDHERAA
jgi:ribosomal protein S3